jgi:D-alanyl-lipoteichoic acid acyltransferase DltB (MBOAT superfamily)
VYNRRFKAEKNFIQYALYVLFYPQLVAGPIERPAHLLPQLKLDKPFNPANVVMGLQRIMWGLFKKMVVGDGISDVVDTVFSHLDRYTGFSLWVGIAAFTVQIFCDFSGYSDIAIGCARIMGVELSENFNAPYLAHSLSGFWRRWHMSLSTWFRDYVYIPLGGNRTGIARWVLNILIVFGLSGLWHGANYTFILWGLMHGLGLIAERGIKNTGLYNTLNNAKPKWVQAIGFGLTLVFVSLAWVLFRANNIHQAIYIYTHLNIPIRQLINPAYYTGSLHFMELSMFTILFYLLCIALMLVVYFGQHHAPLKQRWQQLPVFWRWTAYYGIMAIILCFGIYEHRTFIYFQF